MPAAVVVDDGGARSLAVREVPRPSIGQGEVLVRVRAAGLNRADLALNAGHFRNAGAPTAAATAGVEFAGEVAEVGPGVSGFHAGDRVMAMCQGAFARYAKVHPRLLLRVPDEIGWEVAATAPVALMTAHDALVTRAGLRTGEVVLVQAVTSGVGIVACRMARLLGAGLVIGTSGSAARLAKLAELGLGPDVAIDTSREDTAGQVRAATGGHGADVIVDLVGGPCLETHLRSVALRGRIVCVGRMGGSRGELDLDLLSTQRATIVGVTFRTRSLDEIAAVAARMGEEILPQVASGALRWPVDQSFPLASIAQAYDWMRSRGPLGKVAITVD